MSTTVEAIYEDGELLLRQRLPLAEKAHVRVTVEINDATFQIPNAPHGSSSPNNRL
jgi:predicted DNA-binding antitoxin AbrB/MazE fold protein